MWPWLFPLLHRTLHYLPVSRNNPGTHPSSQLDRLCPVYLDPFLILLPLKKRPLILEDFHHVLPRQQSLSQSPVGWASSSGSFLALRSFQSSTGHLTRPPPRPPAPPSAPGYLETILNSSSYHFTYILFTAFECLDLAKWFKEKKKLLFYFPPAV